MKYLLFLIIPCLVLSWNPPINLSQMPGDDINPQVCRNRNFLGTDNCLVWQKVTTEAWNILARFYDFWGNWDSVIFITRDSVYNNENPVVARDYISDKSWVAWQKQCGFDNWEIFIAKGDPNGFDSSFRLTNSLDYQDEKPSLFVLWDTVWVTWESNGDSATRILAKCYDGTNWSEDFIVDQGNNPFVSNPRISVRHNHPIIVYEKWSRCFSHIYYSEYLDSIWTAPAIICDDSGYNYNPEIVCNDCSYPYSYLGVIILWNNQLSRDVFRTAYDTFNLHYRITQDTTKTDIRPTGIIFEPITFDQLFVIFAWQRDECIYSNYWFVPELFPVDTADSCSKPCLTETGGCIWCIYQRNVGNNWEIFGTYESYGIEEKPSNRVKAKRLITFNQIAALLRDKKYEVYDITGRAVKNYLSLRSGIYFLKIGEEKVSAVIVK